MRKRYRWLSTCAVGMVALAAAGGASAALTPKLAVTTDVNGDTTVTYSQAASDDPLALLAVFVPLPYTSNFGFDDGAQVGTVTVKGVAGDQGGAPVTLTGTVNFAAAATATVNYAGAQAALSALATACTGSAAKSAFTVMNLSGGGQTVQIPLYDDIIVTGTQFSDTSIIKLTTCFPPPDTPTGTAGRAPLGLKVTDVSIVFQGVFGPPPGWYIWHAQAVPYTPASGKVNTAGGVEAQSQDRTPQELSLAAAVDPKTHQLVARGQVKQGGKGVAGATVQILAGKKVVAKTTSGAGGRFKVPVKTTAGKLSATASLDVRPLPGCTQAILAPLPCTSATIGGFTVASEAVAVKRS